MSDPLDDAWRRGAFPYAYALSLVRLAPSEDAQHPYRTEAPPLEQAQLWHDHGQRCWQVAKHDEAEHALQRAYEIRRTILGIDDPLTLDTAERLAAVASARGQAELATGRFRGAIAGLERAHGAQSVRVAIARRNYAAHLRDLGELGHSKSELDRAIEVLSAALPVEDPEYVDALKVLAYGLVVGGQPYQAIAVADRAIKLGAAAWDTDHPFVAAIELTAARAERALGQSRAARKRLARAIPCLERSYGNHPLTALALHELARVEVDDANHDVAEDLARRALAMYRAFHPTGLVGSIAATLIRIAAERGQFAEASALVGEYEPLATGNHRHAPRLVLARVQIATGRLALGLANLRAARRVAPVELHADFDAEIRALADELGEPPPR